MYMNRESTWLDGAYRVKPFKKSARFIGFDNAVRCASNPINSADVNFGSWGRLFKRGFIGVVG
jgi:hypothetical protein